MAATGIDPASKPRRSYVYRTLQSLGAEFQPWRDGAMAVRLGASVEVETVSVPSDRTTITCRPSEGRRYLAAIIIAS